jgi:hypothetical protein
MCFSNTPAQSSMQRCEVLACRFGSAFRGVFSCPRRSAWLGVRDMMHGVTWDAVLRLSSTLLSRFWGHKGAFSIFQTRAGSGLPDGWIHRHDVSVSGSSGGQSDAQVGIES